MVSFEEPIFESALDLEDPHLVFLNIAEEWMVWASLFCFYT